MVGDRYNSSFSSWCKISSSKSFSPLGLILFACVGDICLVLYLANFLSLFSCLSVEGKFIIDFSELISLLECWR